MRGLSYTTGGFLVVDGHCLVEGCERVYAAGDVIRFPVKLGGLAAQQAAVAAQAIAARAGAPVGARALSADHAGGAFDRQRTSSSIGRQ